MTEKEARLNRGKQMKLVVMVDSWPTFEAKPLGCLKWGHPALIESFGEHYASLEAYESWLRTTFASAHKVKNGA